MSDTSDIQLLHSLEESDQDNLLVTHKFLDENGRECWSRGKEAIACVPPKPSAASEEELLRDLVNNDENEQIEKAKQKRRKLEIRLAGRGAVPDSEDPDLPGEDGRKELRKLSHFEDHDDYKKRIESNRNGSHLRNLEMFKGLGSNRELDEDEIREIDIKIDSRDTHSVKRKLRAYWTLGMEKKEGEGESLFKGSLVSLNRYLYGKGFKDG